MKYFDILPVVNLSISSLVFEGKTEVARTIFLNPRHILENKKNVVLSVFSHCISTQNGIEKF